MKKFLAFILALACALSLMACGKKNNDDKPDPDPAPDPQPTVITAEFTHGYVDMALDLPEGWSWEQGSDNGTDKTEGIRLSMLPSRESAAPASPVRRSPLPTA